MFLPYLSDEITHFFVFSSYRVSYIIVYPSMRFASIIAGLAVLSVVSAAPVAEAATPDWKRQPDAEPGYRAPSWRREAGPPSWKRVGEPGSIDWKREAEPGSIDW